MHLPLLCLLYRHARIRVVRAGVLVRLTVEPERVEVVADVVMVMNVALRLGAVRRERAPASEQQLERAVVGAEPIDLFEELEQVAAHLNAARAVQVAKVQARIRHELKQRLAVGDPNDDRPVARGDIGLVPERDADRRVAEPAHDLAHDPAIETLRVAMVEVRLRNGVVGSWDAEGFVACSVHRYGSPGDVPRTAYCASSRERVETGPCTRYAPYIIDAQQERIWWLDRVLGTTLAHP